jgi:hypothetical protein
MPWLLNDRESDPVTYGLDVGWAKMQNTKLTNTF